MIKLIGLMDYDCLVQKRYVAPNYDLGLVYAYLKDDPNLNVRLITSFAEQNLAKYDEIYLFKWSKHLAHPSSIIKNYFQLNIKEYGPGFRGREMRPFARETCYLEPNFTCYNPILQLSVDNPTHKLSWNTKSGVKSKYYQHVRLFQEVEGELLRKDVGFHKNKLAIHDEPLMLLTTPAGQEILRELLQAGHKLFFIQPLDISLVEDTNIIEQVIKDKNLATLRNRLMISVMNSSALWFINYFITHKCKRTNVAVLFDKGKEKDYYVCSMLELNYYNHRTKYTLWLRPFYDKEVVQTSPLALCIYRFLYKTPYLMSFYEYVFYMGCKNEKIPREFIRTDEEIYDFVFSKYGMPDLVRALEDWLVYNPAYEEHVFIGGSSKYEKCRRKAYDARRSKYAFERGVIYASEERSS